MKIDKSIYTRFSMLSSLSNWRAWLPSRGNILFTLAIVFAMFWAQSVHALPGISMPAVATSTGVWPYQGRLTNSVGVPFTASVPITFRLYNAAIGGTPLWQEQWPSVQINAGLFNVMLGSITAIPESSVSANNSLWLGITVGADAEMTPRVQLGSVPFAWIVPDGNITTTKLADAAVTSQKFRPTIFEAHLTTEIGIDTTGKDVLTLDVNFPIDGTYLMIVNIFTQYEGTNNGRVLTWVLDENRQGLTLIHNAHGTGGGRGSDSASITMPVNFAAGAHKIILSSSTDGQIAKVRSADIYMIPFAQATTP